jgi:ribosomal protein L11 methyltransferase
MGVSEILDFEKNIYPTPKIINKKFVNIEAYFDNLNEEFLSSLKEVYPELEIEVKEEENKDWLEEWKKGFHAFQLVDKYWIVPSWENILDDKIEKIFIDPGMAFGTGTHETTQICAELIFENSLSCSKESLLDVGSGTGILAFLGKKLGYDNVVGTDNDSEAIRVAEENASLNHLKIDFTNKDLDKLTHKYDVIVANIIDGVLLELKTGLLQSLKEGGSLILSGILAENDSDFISHFLKDTKLKIKKRIQKGEWVGYLLV